MKGANPNWHWMASQRQRRMIERGHQGPRLKDKLKGVKIPGIDLQKLFENVKTGGSKG